MGQSIWKRDLAGKGPKSVKTIFWGSVVVGAIYCLVGFGFLFSPPKGHDNPPAGVALFVGLAALGIVGIAGGILVKARQIVGIVLAWIFAIGMGIVSASAVFFTMTSKASSNPAGIFGPIGLLILSGSMIASLVNRDTHNYMRGGKSQ